MKKTPTAHRSNSSWTNRRAKPTVVMDGTRIVRCLITSHETIDASHPNQSNSGRRRRNHEQWNISVRLPPRPLLPNLERRSHRSNRPTTSRNDIETTIMSRTTSTAISGSRHRRGSQVQFRRRLRRNRRNPANNRSEHVRRPASRRDRWRRKITSRRPISTLLTCHG